MSNMKNIFLICSRTYQWCRPYSSKVFSITVVWFMTRYLGWRLWIWCPCSRISLFSVIFFLLGKETDITIWGEHSSRELSRKLKFKHNLINKSQRHNFKKQKKNGNADILFSTQFESGDIISSVYEIAHRFRIRKCIWLELLIFIKCKIKKL